MERKISAFIQDRLGPNETGPYGLLQTLADVLKLVIKEPIVPQAAHKLLFLMAPALIFVAVFAGFVVVPFAPDILGSNISLGLLFFLGVVAIDIIGLLMAGWAANNKYAFLGSSRAVAQIVSYEIPATTALLVAVLMYGSLNLQEIVASQGIYAGEATYLFGLWDVSHLGGILSWSVVRYPHLLLAFVVYFIASLAECNRAPFDIPEAESELVSGYHVEYSGFNFALVMLAEYAKMLLVSLVAVCVFWGGWNTPLPNIPLPGDFDLNLAAWTSGAPGTVAGNLWGVFWLLIKSLALVGIQMWVRWTYPRLRVDQLMHLCWKVLTPIAFGLFVISGIWKLWEVYAHL